MNFAALHTRLRPILTPTRVAFFASLILSFAAWMTSTINRDGMLYVDTARIFLDQGFAAAKASFQWPFISIFIALSAKLTGLPLEAAGYLHVGVDLFARPNDPLVVAQRHQRLHRDALGFGAHGATHLVGFGVGAISQLGGCHAQNPLDLATWEARIDQGKRAVQRGIDLCPDDDVRAELLQRILCYGRIDTRQLEHHHHIRFREYFADDLLRLAPLFEAGSLRWDADAIVLDRCARLASRSIASQFDPRSAASDCPG